MKQPNLQTYYATNEDIDFATHLFTDTPHSAFHAIHIPAQIILLFTFICFFSAVCLYYPYAIRLSLLGTVCILIFSLPIIIKWSVIICSFLFKKSYNPIYPMLCDDDLPVYSVLVPLYKEHKIFPDLKHYLECLDYPIDKLDIILLLEADDEITLKTVKKYLRRSNPLNIKQLIIPPSMPRTKPKAMNVALNYIKGDYFVIFDAEDRPEPNQLKKAASYFAVLPSDVGALQAKLTYHNPYQTYFLTPMFTLEYDIWFHHFLQGLVCLKLPIPLSGTSTHMRTADIFKIGGWDSYNVTEDCDLGIRLNAQGYQTLILDSVTYEESVSQLSVWIKQRTRWLKGYLQTFVTYLRSPIQSYKIFGLYRMIGIYALIGGQVFCALLHPICWVFYGLNFVENTDFLSQNTSVWFDWVLSFLLVSGFMIPIIQAGMVYLQHSTEKSRLILYSLLYPFYWLCAGYSAYRAVWQLLRCPFKWEKTPHG